MRFGGCLGQRRCTFLGCGSFPTLGLGGSAAGFLFLVLLLLLAFIVALAIAIQPESNGQTEDLGGRPERTADDQGEHDPIVSPANEFDGLARDEWIVMHAGPIEVEAAFATERVIDRQSDDPSGREGVDQQGGECQADTIEGPDVLAEEAMETRPVPLAHPITRINEFGDIWTVPLVLQHRT